MAIIVVAYDGTELTGANHETTDGGIWDKLGATQSPADEVDFVYEGVQAISNKVSNTTGGVDFQSTGTTDLETTPQVVIAVINITTYSLINTSLAKGVAYYIGVGAQGSDYHEYNIFGSGNDYPSRGGFQVIVIDPNIAGYRDVAGTPDLTAVEYYGLYADITATVKAENVVHDTLSYVESGKGLTLTRGDAGSTEGVFQDFLDFDDGTIVNRRGIVIDVFGTLICYATLTIGESGTATEFTDTLGAVIFPDARVNAGHLGLAIDLNGTGTIVDISNYSFTSNGNETIADTRAIFTVIGTTGIATFDKCNFVNFADLTLTSAVTFSNNVVAIPESFTTGGATINGSTFDSPTKATGEAFMLTSDLEEISTSTFISGGAGYAIEIDTAGSYDFVGNIFEGYAIQGGTAGNRMINNSSSGLVTINILGSGTFVTYNNTGGGTTDVVANTVTIEVTVKNTASPPIPIEDARVLCWVDDNDNWFFEISVGITSSGTTASVSHNAHGMANGDSVIIRGCNEDAYNGAYVISNQSTNAYDYTMGTSTGSPATGSPTSTFAILNGLTDIDGLQSDTRTWTVDQAVTGWVSKSSGSPFYQRSNFVATIDKDFGVPIALQMLSDE